MTNFTYIEDDLDYIYIRAMVNGRWESLSLREVTDEQFVDWGKRRFKVDIRDDNRAKGTQWTPAQKIHFLNDMSKRANSEIVTMIRREARNDY